MAQRTRADTPRDRKSITFQEPKFDERTKKAVKRGDGVCENPDCKKFEIRGLTQATKSGYLLCGKCISSSIVRDRLANSPKPGFPQPRRYL
jgi:hypothetical protein